MLCEESSERTALTRMVRLLSAFRARNLRSFCQLLTAVTLLKNVRTTASKQKSTYVQTQKTATRMATPSIQPEPPSSYSRLNIGMVRATAGTSDGNAVPRMIEIIAAPVSMSYNGPKSALPLQLDKSPLPALDL
jgi:hypothetical protein